MAKAKYTREYLGKIIVDGVGGKLSQEQKDESRMERRHLKAYLQGKNDYWDGTFKEITDPFGNKKKVKNFVQVKQKLEKL